MQTELNSINDDDYDDDDDDDYNYNKCHIKSLTNVTIRQNEAVT